MHNNKAQRIRLQGIDCPKKGQPYGNRAKKATSELTFAQRVTVETLGQNKYKRTIDDILLSDGTYAYWELVVQGWRWWYQEYAPEDLILATLEAAARTSKNGLWGDPALALYRRGHIERREEGNSRTP